MTAFTKCHLKQYAAMWGTTGDYSNDGKVELLAAVELKVRWEEDNGEVIQPNGATIGYSDRVMVSQTVAVGSIMWKGRLANVPGTPDDLRQVIASKDITDIKGRIAYRELKLMKYGNTLPTIA